MHPYFYGYPIPHYPSYSSNDHPPQPYFDNSQNWSMHGWQNVRPRGRSHSQNQSNYHGSTPQYGRGFKNIRGNYTRPQTPRPTNPVVAPEQQPRPQPANPVVAREQQPWPQPANSVVAQEQRPRSQPANSVVAQEQRSSANPVVAPEQPPRSQPANSVVAPEHWPSADPVVAPEKLPRSQPADPVVAPEQRSQPANPVVAPEQWPRSQPANPVVAPEEQRLQPANPVVAPKQRPQPTMCRICGVQLSSAKNIEQHNKGGRHRMMLRLQERSKKQNAINGKKRGQMPNSPMQSVIQPKTDNKSNRNGCLVENASSEPKVDKHKVYLKKNTEETSKVAAITPLQTARPTNPVADPKRRPHPTIMCEICEVSLSSEKNVEQHNNGFRHQSMLRQLEKPEKLKGRNRGENGQTPDPLMNLVHQHQTFNKSKSKGHLVENVCSESTPNRHEDYMKKSTEETSKVLAEKCQGELMDSFVAQGHGFKRKIGADEYKEKRERKRRASESSKPDVNTLSNCVESLVQEPLEAQPEGPVALQEFSMVLTVGSSLEPQNDRALQPELEHQVSETIAAHNESLNPTDQANANVQLPSAVAVEFDAPASSNTSTETADGISKAEEKNDVCTTEKCTAPLSQVNVCLKCGDQGFQETLVFCNKCHIYALHRYCLDGPVIFVEDVTWFCEDCEPVVGEIINNNKTSIKQAEENKQQQQNIVAEPKDQLYDDRNLFHHELSQLRNECDAENKVEKECQVVLKDTTANSCEETLTAEHSPATTSDDINSVELEGHAVAEPIIDPIWRGRIRLHNQGTGTFDGLLAHLSSLACCQVLEETKLLPEELCVELLERSEVWPNSFKKCGPDHDSIALYFFPENERAEREFDELVDDIIQFDHAMRVVLQHAELLIFPSTLLPIQYRRFQAKYYLWGVFKAKKI